MRWVSESKILRSMTQSALMMLLWLCHGVYDLYALLSIFLWSCEDIGDKNILELLLVCGAWNVG